MKVGDRVKLHVKRCPNHPAELRYNGRTGIVIDIKDNPWYPVMVSINPDNKGRRENVYFRELECEVIADE